MTARWFTDHPPSTRFPHYTRANAGEVLPTPASPLGQTLVFDQAILPGFQEGSIRMGSYEAEDYRDGAPEMCGFFGGHFYVNLSCVRMQAVRNPAISVEQLDTAIFGARDDTPAYEPHPDDDKPHLLVKYELILTYRTHAYTHIHTHRHTHTQRRAHTAETHMHSRHTHEHATCTHSQQTHTWSSGGSYLKG